MNTKQTQAVNQKPSFKTSRNTMSRNNVKLDTLTRQSQPNSDEGKMTKPKAKNIKGIQKLQKVESVLLKNLKFSSHQFGHEPACDLLNEKINHIERTARPFNVMDLKQEQKSVENKAAASKSFMIRKKNLSCYKKLEEGTKFTQAIKDIHQQVMEEIGFANTLQFKGKISHQKRFNSDCSSEGENEFKIVRQSSKGPLQTSSIHHPNSLKIKPILCKDSKRTSKLLTEIQKQITPKVYQDFENNKINEASKKNIQCILKKFKRVSQYEQESIANFKNHQIKNQMPEDHFHPHDTKIIQAQFCHNLEKIKGFNGCKTIRIPWSQNQGLSDNEIVNKHIKKLGTQQKRKSQEQMQLRDSDDIFGGISIISKKPSLISNIEGPNIPIQSLKELFNELKQSCQKDKYEAVSTEMIFD